MNLVTDQLFVGNINDLMQLPVQSGALLLVTEEYTVEAMT